MNTVFLFIENQNFHFFILNFMPKKINTQNISCIIVLVLAVACHTSQKQVAVVPKTPPVTPHLATSTKDTIKTNKMVHKGNPPDQTAGQTPAAPVVSKPAMIKVAKPAN